jgi:hypothetical protein
MIRGIHIAKTVLPALISLASCGQPDTPLVKAPAPQVSPAQPTSVTCASRRLNDPTVRILFVGNSLTYSNNLPQLIEDMGSRGGKNMVSDMLALPNYALEDHWHDKKIQKLICEGDFDFVVVQQGPSSQADGRAMLLDYGQRIKDVCDSRGTELAFFMVWPAKANWHTFEGVIRNYSDAANQTDSRLCAVGVAFKELGDDGDFHFYSSDNFHPSVEGSQIAAEIIYLTLIKD